MQTLAQIRQLLEERSLRPKRSLGQNFLIDHNLLRKLVDAAHVSPTDTILEVGPGTGTLTEELLARAARVVASELDDNLASMLQDRAASGAFTGAANLAVVRGDCLHDKHTLAPAVLEALLAAGSPPNPFKLVANLPYGAATPLLSTLLIHHLTPQRLHASTPSLSLAAITVQREAADRITAHPRTKEYGPLSVLAQALCTTERIATLPPECFWPRPDVTSAMLLLTPRAQPLTDNPRALSDFCRTLFSHRRKQLGAVFARAHRSAAPADIPWPPGITPRMRAEELSVPQIIELTQAIAAP